MNLSSSEGEHQPADEAPPLSPEQQEQAKEMAAAMAQARAEILEADPSAIVANHAFGMYELAAIHLTSEDPDFAAARLAIDALAALVEGLKGRLDESERALQDGLHQIRIMFVQRHHDVNRANNETDNPAETDASAREH